MPAPTEFIQNAMLDSYFSLCLAELSDLERGLLSDKVRLVAASIAGDEEVLADILKGIDSRAMRSKLLTLILGFRHRTLMLGFNVVEQLLAKSSCGHATSLTIGQTKELIIRSDELFNAIIARSRLSLH